MKKILKQISISNIFIFLSFVWTFLYFLWFWEFFEENIFWNILKMFIFTFFHWDLFHFLMNAIWILYFWNILEQELWKNKYLIFFFFTVIFKWILIIYITHGFNVIWISGFCMAILSYYTLDLKQRRNPEYKTWIFVLWLNILIWLYPWISLLWHLFWAIAGVIFYFLNRKVQKKLVWLV